MKAFFPDTPHKVPPHKVPPHKVPHTRYRAQGPHKVKEGAQAPAGPEPSKPQRAPAPECPGPHKVKEGAQAPAGPKPRKPQWAPAPEGPGPHKVRTRSRRPIMPRAWLKAGLAQGSQGGHLHKVPRTRSPAQGKHSPLAQG